jgi:hypothetical protein
MYCLPLPFAKNHTLNAAMIWMIPDDHLIQAVEKGEMI